MGVRNGTDIVPRIALESVREVQSGRSWPQKRDTDHAFTPSNDGFDRSGCIALVSEWLHSDGGIDQIDIECGRRHRRGALAHECLRTSPFALANPRGRLA